MCGQLTVSAGFKFCLGKGLSKSSALGSRWGGRLTPAAGLPGGGLPWPLTRLFPSPPLYAWGHLSGLLQFSHIE